MPRSHIPDFPPPTVVTDTDALSALCQRLASEEFVTVDTEFMREKTYYPELCLVQLAGETEVAVIDTVSDRLDLTPLGELLANPAGSAATTFLTSYALNNPFLRRDFTG